MNLSLVIFVISCLTQFQASKTATDCRSQNGTTIIKQLGSTFKLDCSRSSNCGTFNYTYYDKTTGESQLVHRGPMYVQKISNLNAGGDYCCINQCPKSKTILSTTAPECCVTVSILPVTLWDVPKFVGVNGDPITGSCSASGYPRPNVRVVIPGCDYQQENVHVGKYTNRAVFTMNVTKNCSGLIYCWITSKTYSILRTKEFTIVENVFCGGKSEVKPTKATIKTSTSKDEVSFLPTRSTENDHKAVTDSRANGVTATTCSILMIFLLITFSTYNSLQ